MRTLYYFLQFAFFCYLWAIPNSSYAQKTTSNDTSKFKSEVSLEVYDLKGLGYGGSIIYALRHGINIPVIVDIQGDKNDSLKKIVEKVMTELDAAGYKNMVLLTSDPSPTNTVMSDCILFYCKGAHYFLLGKGPGVTKEIWTGYDKDHTNVLKDLSGKFDADSYIRAKIKETYKKTGIPISQK